jgi:hypothetical protein
MEMQRISTRHTAIQREQQFPHMVTHPHSYLSPEWGQMITWLDEQFGAHQYTWLKSSQMRFCTADQAALFSITWC